MKAFLPSIAKRRPILFCLLFASLSILVATSPIFAAVEPVTYELLAGQHIEAGTVSVWNDDEHLYVKYVTTDGWHLAETHMHFATSLDGIPQTKKGNPIPGQFDYKTEHLPKVMEFTYEADLNGLEPDDMLYFACQADVELLDQNGNTIQEEGAWAGNEQFPGKNWATYFIYEVQAGDSDPPSIDITNPLDNSVITDTTPFMTIKFSDDESGINLNSLQIMINGEDYTGNFVVSETSAKYRMVDPLNLGSQVISASISDNAGNTTTTACNFTCTTSTEPIRFIFSVKNNQWIHASPGDGTCIEYLNSDDLGILDSADLIALSRISPAGKIYFALYNQGGILQSPADGSNELYFDNEQLGLSTGAQILAGHIGVDGSAYYATEGQSDLWHSMGDYNSGFFKQSAQLGIQDSSQLSCLHIGYGGTIYFCHADGEGIFESIADGTNSQYLTAADLGVPGSEIDAFAVLPETNPPTINITNPIDGAFLYTTTPNIIVSFQDTESGIDPATFYSEINGQDMSSAFAVTETGATYQVPGGSPLPVGENSILVKIKDRSGNEASDTSTFSIGTLRAIPGANPTTGPAPLTVYFTTDGEDPAGTIQVFRWDFNGDGTWDTYTEVALDYTHTYNTPGTYNATLYVQSSTGETATASISITVENNPPVASADVVPSNGEVPLNVNFSGSGTDIDGSIVLYEWDFEGDGTFDWSSTTTGNTTHTYTDVGTYNAVFRVTDDNGLTDTAVATTTAVRAGPPGSPTAVASANPASGNAPLTVNLSASGSFDPEGNLVLYEWDFNNDGTYDFSSATTGDTNHTYTEAGTHVASLRVTDAEGFTGIDQVLITVNIQTSLTIQRDTIGFLSSDGALTPSSASASSSYSSSYSPTKAIDNNTSTFWYSAYGGDAPGSWFEIGFSAPQTVSSITVNWYDTYYMMTRARIDIYDVNDNLIYSQEKNFSGNPSQVTLPDVANASRLRLVTITSANSGYLAIKEFKYDVPTTPGEPVGTNINTTISADTQVSILVKDDEANIVRTLVNNEFRTKGSYADYWNCKDGSGFLVNDGVYHAILQYIVDGQVQTYDLTYSTGGSRYSGIRANTGGSQSNPKTFSPFEDDFLPISFTLSNAAEVTLFVGYLWGQDTRIRTLTNRVPYPAGTHTVYWDGLDDNEQIATAPPGWYLIPGAWAYTLPDNAMVMTGGRPEIIDIVAEPNYFSPFSEKCDENGMDEGVILTYSISENVAQVEFRCYSLETGALLRTDVKNNISVGENTYFWDGKNNNGEYVDIGDYQVGVIATDEDGNVSMLRYALVRIDY